MKGGNFMNYDKNRRKTKDSHENERRIEHLENLVERRTRTKRHLEQYSNISSPDNIDHANRIQNKREEEIENLKEKIVYGDKASNDQEKNVEKRYRYTQGYLDNNSENMDLETLKNTEEKQEHRKEQMDFF